MNKIALAAAILGLTVSMQAAAEDTEKFHISAPQIHGAIRTRWEGEWADRDCGDNGGFASRFEVRNARINVGGSLPWSIDYYLQFDACNQGKMQFLDAWARWRFAGRWRVQAGQFRVPFGVDCFKGPATYLFANRSFLGKHMLNMRQVGVKLGFYGASSSLPLDIEAGVFNTAATSNHDVWQKDYTYAAKAVWYIGNVSVSAGFITYKPQSVRVNVADGAVTWKWSRWIVEGEYQHKYYASHAYKAVNAWNLYGVYTVPLNWRAANYWSMEARFDGMTDHSTAKTGDDGILVTDHASRRRITVGSTIGKVVKGVKAEFRINYEKYFYNRGVVAPRGQSDKLLAEIALKF